MKIALVGNGRMGRMIGSICSKSENMEVVGMVGPGDSESLGAIEGWDVAMDFSYPGNLTAMLETAKARKLPLVIGTTGLSKEQGEEIRTASAEIPIVWADNFSTGMNVMARLVRIAAQAMKEDFDIEIIETHHNQKVDAPSGSAKMLLRSIDPDGKFPLVNGRVGITGKRGREIGVHAVRGGTVAGEHSVMFYGPMEEIELRHRADSREIFARGALRAAAFAVTAKPGLYDMEDILFGGH